MACLFFYWNRKHFITSFGRRKMIYLLILHWVIHVDFLICWKWRTGNGNTIHAAANHTPNKWLNFLLDISVNSKQKHWLPVKCCCFSKKCFNVKTAPAEKKSNLKGTIYEMPKTRSTKKACSSCFLFLTWWWLYFFVPFWWTSPFCFLNISSNIWIFGRILLLFDRIHYKIIHLYVKKKPWNFE